MTLEGPNNILRAQSAKPAAPTSAQNGILCTHCGTPVVASSPSQAVDSPIFCCAGCQLVYEILQARGLAKYYDLKSLCVPIRKTKPVTVSTETYAYLDEPDFQQSYMGIATPTQAAEPARTIDFYLEGVHCVACLWLVEKLPEFLPGVISAELDIGKSVAHLVVKASAQIAPIAQELDRLGYRPHAIRKDEQAEELQKRENRRWLIRIGVAAACTGNIMLMVVPLYAGATGSEASLFRWISFALFFPVLFYSGTPFFQSAWAALRGRKMSIDVPIVLAVLLGTVVSTYNLFHGSKHMYFDSLSALVFLLLASRYFLRRIQQTTLSSSHLLNFLSPSRCKRLNEETEITEDISVSHLRVDDLIIVPSGEMIPADGIVTNSAQNDAAHFVSMALLTGEAAPQRLREGDIVYSGTKNEGDQLTIRVTAIGPQSRIGSILKQAEEASLRKADIVQLADRAARWFLIAVLVGAAAVFFATPGIEEALNRALALIIVTCPCALALATPLSLSVSLSKAAKLGILIKGANALEKLSHTRTVCLDKTGTLTQGRFDVLEWIWSSHLSDTEAKQTKVAVLELEKRSRHPIAKALVRYLANSPTACPEVNEFHEELGKGVFGTVGEHRYAVRALETHDRAVVGTSTLATTIGIHRDESLVAQVWLGDQLRDDSHQAIKLLRDLGIEPEIVSGDNYEVVEQVSAVLGISRRNYLAQASPEQKRNHVQGRQNLLMVGDGANDAIALSSAYISAAVHGSVELSLRTADIYLAAPGVLPIVRLIETARETMYVIRRNLIFSLLYNIAGAAAAVTGLMNPLFAAVLMPFSALTVFGSSIWGTRKLRALLETHQ